jgi:chromosome segregation ATPase
VGQVSEILIVAGVAGAVASLITAVSAVVGFVFMRGRNEGGLSSKIEALMATIDDLKTEIEAAIKRADHAHDRLDETTKEHHALREMIARECVTYERMRELKSELVNGMAALTKSTADQLAGIHGRLDTLIHTVAKPAGRPQDG